MVRTKRTEIVATSYVSRAQNMPKCVPLGITYSTFPDSLTGFKGVREIRMNREVEKKVGKGSGRRKEKERERGKGNGGIGKGEVELYLFAKNSCGRSCVV